MILADAFREAEIVRGEGGAEAAGIYAEACNRDAEFYGFYRSLNAYREAFSGAGDLFVLDPKSEFFRYLNSATGNQ